MFLNHPIRAEALLVCLLQVFRVSEDGHSTRLQTSAVNLGGEAAGGLFGGALLGVKLSRVQRVGDPSTPTLHPLLRQNHTVQRNNM